MTPILSLHQQMADWNDLSLPFQFAVLDTWQADGHAAACCFALGA